MSYAEEFSGPVAHAIALGGRSARRRDHDGGARLVRWPLGVILVTVLLLAGCGYVGDPLPPALNIPVRISDLAAVERGESIIAEFTVFRMTTEGLVLKRFGELDLRIGAEGLQPFDMSTWRAHSRRIEIVPEVAPGRIRVRTPASAWAGREVLLAVRLSNHKGRWSEWSNLVALHVTQPLGAPTGLEAENVRQGVRLSWRDTDNRPGLRYRVLRGPGDGGPLIRAAETDQPTWLDTATRYGAPYAYRVQSVEQAGDDVAESELTPPVSITPVDRFPPAVPAGFTVMAGLNSIELAWQWGEAPDLAGYCVYRSGESEPNRRIAESLTAPSYSDHDVRPGKRYTYTVTSVDEFGNESEPSAARSGVIP